MPVDVDKTTTIRAEFCGTPKELADREAELRGNRFRIIFVGQATRNVVFSDGKNDDIPKGAGWLIVGMKSPAA